MPSGGAAIRTCVRISHAPVLIVLQMEVVIRIRLDKNHGRLIRGAVCDHRLGIVLQITGDDPDGRTVSLMQKS